MLKQQLNTDMKAAMKGRDRLRLGVIRLVNAAIKQREIDERIELDDSAIIAVLDKMAKQRRESMEQYRSAGRDDLLQQEAFELEVLQHYLPAALSDSEVNRIINTAIENARANTIKDIGKVMGLLKPLLQGRADMSAVSAKTKARLS